MTNIVPAQLGRFLEDFEVGTTYQHPFGRTISEAITARDYVVVQGFTVVVSVGYVLVNLLTDISYAYLDPRVRMDS